MVKKIRMLRFRNQTYQKKNNIGANALSRKPNYKNFNRPTKPMLIRKNDYMQVAEATEENQNIIKKAHDAKLAGYQRVFKPFKRIQKNTTWKGIKANVEKYVKSYPTCAIKKHDRSRKKGLHHFLQPPEIFF